MPHTKRSHHRIYSCAAAILFTLASVAVSRLPAAANDLCEEATVIVALPFDDTRDTTGATTSGTDPVHICSSNSQDSNSVWYSFTPTASGLVTAFTTGSDYDTVLAVYTGGCGAPVEVGCNDDISGGSIAAQLTFAVTTGTTYLVQVTVYEGQEAGTLRLGLRSVRTADNDECAAPTVIGAVPFADTLDAGAATTSPSDPEQSCSFEEPAQNSRSVWYAFTPAGDGVVRASTFASSYDTVVTAYKGACGTLTEVACDDDTGDGLQSEVIFPVDAGTTYLLEVTEFAPAEAATLHFKLQFAPPLHGCQKAITKAAATFVAKKLKSLDKCSGGVSKCIQTKADDKREECVAKANKKCLGEFDKIAKEEETLKGKILQACDEHSVSFDNLVDRAIGLGFESIEANCNSKLDDALAVAQCIVRQHDCQTERLFEVEEPRAKELMQQALAQQTDPPAVTLDCLANYGGSGLDVEDPDGGKALVKCQATVKKAAAKFAKSRLKSLGKCIDKIFACQQKKPGDDRCVEKAGATCDKEFTKIGKAANELYLAVDKKCSNASVDYETLLAAPAGSNLGALGTECALYDVSLAGLDDYKRCLCRQHERRLDDILRFGAPNADTLLDLVGQTLEHDFCP